jgi:DNA-binding winged helix-turn-helix (wHTH) protein
VSITYRFGDFVVSLDARKLLRHGADVDLSPKAFELLKALVEAYPRALSKVELHDRLWRGIFVTPGSLALLVAELRTALRDDARSFRYIRTLHGFGYAFAAEVTQTTDAGANAWLRGTDPGL